MSQLAFHPAARKEAVKASLYLENARFGYGDKFEEELVRLSGHIVEHPNSGSPLDGYPADLDVRAYRMQTFRYSLIVAKIDGVPMVCAVAHQHRKTGYWRDRLK